MIKLVESSEEQALFQRLLDEANTYWKRNHVESPPSGHRYLIGEKPSGIIEFTKSNASGSGITPYDPNFYDRVKITHDLANMYEIGNLFVRRSEQAKGHLKCAFQAIYDHHRRTDSEYYAMLIVKKLYRSVRVFRLLERVGQPLVQENGAVLYPVVFSAEKAKRHPIIKHLLRINTTV